MSENNIQTQMQTWAIEDMSRQVAYLKKEARFFGFSSPELLLKEDGELFDKIAATWRKMNPAPRMN